MTRADIIPHLRDTISKAEKKLTDAMASDCAEDWSHYRFMAGEISGLRKARMALDSLVQEAGGERPPTIHIQ